MRMARTIAAGLVSVTAVGLVWRWIFNRNFGVLNAILGWFGIAPVNWLHAASNSMLVMVISTRTPSRRASRVIPKGCQTLPGI